MAKYNVKVIENLSRVVEIEADSYEKAQEIAEKQYRNCDIILDYNDMNGTTYAPYPSQNISNNFSITLDFNKKSKQLFINDKGNIVTRCGCKTKEDLKSFINSYIEENILYDKVKSSGKFQMKCNKEREEK